MSLYGHKLIQSVNEADDELKGLDLTPYIEMLAYDDISRGSEEQIHEFMESELATVLTEKNVLSKKSVYKLNMRDIDKKRRIKMVAYQMAKENNDPAFKKMTLYRDKWKEQRAIIMKKYGKRAIKVATVAQKEYIKAAKKEEDKPAEK